MRKCSLNNQGFKTLVIDLDPQGNATQLMGGKRNSRSIYEAILGKVEIGKAIQKTEGPDLIASSPLLTQLGADLQDEAGREYRLKEILEDLPPKAYDYVLIDTPPALGIHTANALTSSDYVLITANADVLSLQGMEQLNTTIKTIKKRTNKELKILGILISRFQARVSVDQTVLDYLESKAEEMETIVFDTKIRNCSAVKEAQIMNQDIYTYAPKSNASKDFTKLTLEVLELTGHKKTPAPPKKRSKTTKAT